MSRNNSRNKLKNTTLEKLHKKKINDIYKNELNINKKYKQLQELKLKNKNTEDLENQINELKFKGTKMDYFNITGDLIIDYYEQKNHVNHTNHDEEKQISITELFNQPVVQEKKTNKILSSYVKRLEGIDIDKYNGTNRIIK